MTLAVNAKVANKAIKITVKLEQLKPITVLKNTHTVLDMINQPKLAQTLMVDTHKILCNTKTMYLKSQKTYI